MTRWEQYANIVKSNFFVKHLLLVEHNNINIGYIIY